VSDQGIIEELRKTVAELATAAENAAQFVERRGYDQLAKELRLPAVKSLILLDAIHEPLRIVTPDLFRKGWVYWPPGDGVRWKPFIRVFNNADGNVVVVDPESE
jgi:hypothetical protein